MKPRPSKKKSVIARSPAGKVKLSDLKPNPKNPRLIKSERFTKLVTSIKDFPAMMELRPIVIDENSMVLGGNMRLAALKELGYTELPSEWVKRASELTEDQKKEFIIKDNVGFGEMDWDMIANDWEPEQLIGWGLEMNFFNPDDPNKEYEGMPEFNNKDLSAFQAIHVHFKSQEAIDEFSELIKQKISPTTRAMWFPKATLTDMKSEKYLNEA